MKRRKIFTAAVTAALCLVLCAGCGNEKEGKFDTETQRRLDEMQGFWSRTDYSLSNRLDLVVWKWEDKKYSIIASYTYLFHLRDGEEKELKPLVECYGDDKCAYDSDKCANDMIGEIKRIAEENGIEIDDHTPMLKFNASDDHEFDPDYETDGVDFMCAFVMSEDGQKLYGVGCEIGGDRCDGNY